MLPRSLPVEANWIVFAGLLLSVMFTFNVVQVDQPPVGAKLMLDAAPFTVIVPARAAAPPFA